MGALRFSFGGPWEVFRRVELGTRQEEYQWIGSYPQVRARRLNLTLTLTLAAGSAAGGAGNQATALPVPWPRPQEPSPGVITEAFQRASARD